MKKAIALTLASWLLSLYSAFAAQKPNILLFTADDMHAESMRIYGSRSDMTPQLDAFAEKGFVFNKAHVNAAICAPSRAVIATGLLSHNSGAMGFMQAREGTPHLVEIFQKNGYLTGILGKVPHSTPVPGMTWDYTIEKKDLGAGRSPTRYYERSKAFLERCKSEKKPFYLMVNSHDPHRKYCDPEKLIGGAEMPSKVYKPEEVEVPGFVPDLPGVRKELAMYQNSTRRLDDTFGRVMDALEETGFNDNTLVIFMSDNGIAIPFAKCNTWFHATRTPMLCRLPGVVKTGVLDDKHFVSGVDLMPTFFELTGIEGPEKMDGRSFLSILKGGEQDGRDVVFTQIDKKNGGGPPVPMRCIQDEHYAYIYNPFSDGELWYQNANEGLTMKAMNEAAETDPEMKKRVDLFRYRVPEELYNLKKDRDNLVNLIDNPEQKETLKRLKKKLEAWMVETNDPLLEAFRHMDDRAKVDAVIDRTFAEFKARKKKK